jgi:hypothetical protein
MSKMRVRCRDDGLWIVEDESGELIGGPFETEAGALAWVYKNDGEIDDG